MNKFLQFSNVINLLFSDPVAVYFSGKQVFYEKMCSKFFFTFSFSVSPLLLSKSNVRRRGSNSYEIIVLASLNCFSAITINVNKCRYLLRISLVKLPFLLVNRIYLEIMLKVPLFVLF